MCNIFIILQCNLLFCPIFLFDKGICDLLDAGASWTKQLDGRAVNDIILADIKAKLAADPGSTRLQGLEAEAERNQQAGPDKPFLDVWFENDTTGASSSSTSIAYCGDALTRFPAGLARSIR